jgi:5-methylcytosine-specific restriction enzyme A
MKKPCARPGCPALVERGYCAACRPSSQAAVSEKARGSAASRGYGRAWQKAAAAYLRIHPIAVDWFNEHGNRPQLAQVVDHIVPHRGDMKLFWDSSNWQGLTKTDHDRKTAIEDGGFGRGGRGGRISHADGA